MTERYAIWRPRAEHARPMVIHAPHAAGAIPEADRRDFALGDRDLAREAEAVASTGTGRLASLVLAHGGFVFANRISPLVVDPVRSPAQEDGARAPWGSAAVPTVASDGRPLRRADWSARDSMRVMRSYYFPYHGALSILLTDLKERFDHPVGLVDLRCVVTDDLHGGQLRFFLGYDEDHAPEPWLRWWRGRVGIEAHFNDRLVGAFVPEGVTKRRDVCALTIGIDRQCLAASEALVTGLIDLFFAFACGLGKEEAAC